MVQPLHDDSLFALCRLERNTGVSVPALLASVLVIVIYWLLARRKHCGHILSMEKKVTVAASLVVVLNVPQCLSGIRGFEPFAIL